MLQHSFDSKIDIFILLLFAHFVCDFALVAFVVFVVFIVFCGFALVAFVVFVVLY